MPDDSTPLATTEPSKEAHSKEALELWTDLCEKDDRTSPEEYPDMALITQDEFCAALDRFRAAGAEKVRALVIEELTCRFGDGEMGRGLTDAVRALAARDAADCRT